MSNSNRKWHQSPPEGYIHGSNDDDLYDPVSAGKAALMTTMRPMPLSSTGGGHHHHFVGSSSQSPQHATTPPAYCVNTSGSLVYPPYQQYCSGGSYFHRHSPNYNRTAENEGNQTSTGLTLLAPDGVECSLHGGCRHHEHVYESAGFGARLCAGRNAGQQRVVGFVDEQLMPPPSGTLVGGGSAIGELTTSTVVCPLHYDVTGDVNSKLAG